MSYQRVTDPGYNTGKVRIGVIAPIRPRRLNSDELVMQSIILGRSKRTPIWERFASFVLGITR